MQAATVDVHGGLGDQAKRDEQTRDDQKWGPR